MSRTLLLIAVLAGCAPDGAVDPEAFETESAAQERGIEDKFASDEELDPFGRIRFGREIGSRKIMGGQEGEPVVAPGLTDDFDSDGASPTDPMPEPPPDLPPPPPPPEDTGDTGL